MSNLIEILIEKLQLQRLLCERVFVKWEDQSGTPFTLGSRLNDNRQNLKFLMAVYYDMQGHIHIHFSLKVSITLHGNKHEMELLLVVPPDADFASKPRLISNISDLSRLDASAIHDAEISDSACIIPIQFDLIAEGFVVMKKKIATTIKPWNTTSKDLIRRLESLSNTKTFTAYVKGNNYAKVGLEGICNRLSNTGTPTDTRKTNMKEMYIQQGSVLVEWSRFDPIPPPLYTDNPTELFPGVQVPRTPPINTTIEAKIAATPATSMHGIFSPSREKTPARIPASPKSTSVHSICSPSREELSDKEMNFDVDSDEEHLANLNLRELSEQFNHDSEVSKMLESRFVEWIQAAMRINSNIYKHKHLITKLSILGNCVCTSNTSVFDATIPWCSALFFYDPLDSDNTPELWEKRNLWLISDIAKLIQWVNEDHYGAEMSPLLINHFMELGKTARTVALHSRYNQDNYSHQKSICIAHIYMKFGKLCSGISVENSKSVS
ncbi:hypothetical protein BOTCAL_0111g00030 [Botryotinia calthae]|uniref:Uncharacterized protein n=1 Tax=Botryotinia calthae TaxID=38488 RepID=A0A4Y8D565_9HELO|nr:hypothetical protein BOTCAL_0111g00030 [Botryotinia calthae]